MAFVRVKRRYDEDPFNSVVVSHKKLKTIGDSVFQFAATIKNENENLSQILKEVREGKSVKYLTKTGKCNSINDVIEHSKTKRLKLVNNLRAVKQDTVPFKEKDGEDSEIKVVDFVKQKEDNGKPLVDEGISVDYVYDVYYSSINNDKSIDIQDIDSVHGFDSNNFFDIYENPDDLDDSSPCEDDDDSNDEGNWRNDYPDEDETDNSADEYFENLVNQTNKWHINSNSSSEVEEEENVDFDNFHKRFARYRTRVKAEENSFFNSVIDDSSSESSSLDD